MVSILFLFGKIALATAIVTPFKAKIGEIVPPVKGELRVQKAGGGGVKKAAGEGAATSASNTTTTIATHGAPGGVLDGAPPPPRVPSLRHEISIEEIMAAVDPADGTGAATADEAASSGGGGGCVDADADADDMESGRCGRNGGGRGKTEKGGGHPPVKARQATDGARAVRPADSPGCKEGELGEGDPETAGRSYSPSSHFDEKTEEGLAPAY